MKPVCVCTWERERKMCGGRRRRMFIIWWCPPQLFCPHSISAWVWSAGISWGATILSYITSSTKSPPPSLPPHNQIECLWCRHLERSRGSCSSRAVTQEAPSRLKVRSHLLSAPREAAGDSRVRHVERRIQEGTRPHKDAYIYVN